MSPSLSSSLLLLALVGCGSVGERRQPIELNGTWLMLGASNTAQYFLDPSQRSDAIIKACLPTWTVYNAGVGGSTIADCKAMWHAWMAWIPADGVVSIDCGISDIVLNDADAAAVEASLADLVADVKPRVGRVIVSPILPFGGSSYFWGSPNGPAREATRLAVNSWLEAGDLGPDVSIADASEPVAPGYSSPQQLRPFPWGLFDGIHLWVGGADWYAGTLLYAYDFNVFPPHY